MAKLVNLTPHAIKIRINGEIIEVPPSGVITRVVSKDEIVDQIDNIPVVLTKFGEVSNLPQPEENTYYLVSSLVAERVKRPDVLAPDTMTAERDEFGRIVCVNALRRFE
jgi:hypothetical protein